MALICREEGKKMAFRPHMNEIVGQLVNTAQRSRQYRLAMERSIGIVKVVSKLDLHLGFKDIVEQFDDWGFLKPYLNYPSFRRSVRYGKLSEYTHETEKTLDFFKNVISHTISGESGLGTLHKMYRSRASETFQTSRYEHLRGITLLPVILFGSNYAGASHICKPPRNYFWAVELFLAKRAVIRGYQKDVVGR